MRRLLISSSAIAILAGFLATPSASAQYATVTEPQTLTLYLGGFLPTREGSRDVNDVLLQNEQFLAFRIQDFDFTTFGGEWLFPIGHNFEGGAGVGYFQRTVPSTYLNLVNSNGAEITQTLQLRIVPFTATLRVLPFGTHAPIKPYFGGGVAVYYWHYNESGQWVDADNNIFLGSFTGSGGAVGPVVLGGVRAPVGMLDLGFEVRWQGGEGTLPTDQGFAGTKIELSGMNYLFTVGIKF